MNLVIDIGNTRSKIGLFEGKYLVEQAICDSPALAEWQAYGNRDGVEYVMVCSVAEPDPALQGWITTRPGAMELTRHTPLPFENRYRTPETLGKDRLAGVAGAQALFPGRHCLVVDCGTCIKYEWLSAEGVYHGGNIAPGARMRIRAMHHFTARLPEVDMHLPADFTGVSTETALQNGALRGAALEIEGFARLFAARYGKHTLILTGGDAAFFQPLLDVEHLIVEPDLTLFGLNHILNYNT